MENKRIKRYLSKHGAWIVLFAAFFLFMQIKGQYSLYFIEQWHLFLYDWIFIKPILLQPGGTSRLAANFLIQFFIHPYCGPLIVAGLLLLISKTCSIIFKRLSPSFPVTVVSLLPGASLMFLQFNVHYQLSGTISFLFFTTGFALYLTIKPLSTRLICATFSSLLLYILAGPVATLYVASIILTEAFRNFGHMYYFFLPAAVVYFLAAASLRIGIAGSFKYLLLPDGYFAWKLQAGNVIYLPWILFLTGALLSLIFYQIRVTNKNIRIANVTVQSIIVAGFVVFGSRFFIDSNNETFKEFDYYMRHENWDKILQRSKDTEMNNYLFQNFQNVALAEKGLLAEHLFDYQQRDLQSIYLSWDKTPFVSVLLSDVYFSMGHIAMAQRMAFESNESVNNYNPRMLKRLIQTNLIYGAYPVAEKYIGILEKTRFYAEWAHAHRRFLENSNAVESDSLLGSKRRCLFPDNVLSGKNGFDSDLKNIIDYNPGHQATIQYLGAIYLLLGDIDSFKNMLGRYYGTKALPFLPKGFQEGVLLFAADDKQTLQHYNISHEVIESYEPFRYKRNSKKLYWNSLIHRKKKLR